MWFFNMGLLPFLVFGILCLLFAKTLGNWGIRSKPDSLFSIPIMNKIFVVWTVRAIGIMSVCFFFYMGINRPCMDMMKKAENRLVLLEKGEIVKGKVMECWYDDWAPSAWMILYGFEAPNPKDSQPKSYWGTARGPKQYYSSFSEGDTVSIIYNPAKPKINCEMYCFLNNPSYRRTFRKAGKLQSLALFQNQFKMENYSEMTWLDSAREK